MFNRGGLDRFKKAQSTEPFSVNSNSGIKPTAHTPHNNANSFKLLAAQPQKHQIQQQHQVHNVAPRPTPQGAANPAALAAGAQATAVGEGQSTWQPPEWTAEPRPGVFRLEVVKDGEVLDHISLDKRRHIFGRQLATCDYVLDHPSISRQHAAVVQHRNGSIYVIDLGSVHGTFVANERLTKDNPVELEVGQSLRFAASSRSYILRKNSAALKQPSQVPTEFTLPPLPDPADEDAVVAYNTLLNRFGVSKLNLQSKAVDDSGTVKAGDRNGETDERNAKKRRKARVAFRDQHGGELVEVVGISDGADVSTEPGPIGVKEGSLIGKYESLVHVTVIPKGQDQKRQKDNVDAQKGVTEKLQQYLNKVKSPAKGGFYEDLYGDSFASKVGGSWAKPSSHEGEMLVSRGMTGTDPNASSNNSLKTLASNTVNHFQRSKSIAIFDEDDDDLFGDMEEDKSRR